MNAPAGLRLLLTTDAVGGVWRYSTTLAAGIAQRGGEALLVTLGPPPAGRQRDALAGVRGVSVEVTDFALEWMDPEGENVARARAGLARIARRFRPDIVHLNSYREADADWDAPVLVVAHSCVASWFRACRGEAPAEPRWAVYAENVRRGLDAADAWAAPTATFRDSIQRLYEPRRRGRVIHNGGEFAPLVAGDEPFILCAGRLWDEAKNVRLLCAIAEDISWPIKLAGAERSQTGATAPCAGVETLGELPHGELVALMRRAGVYAAPALYEPFGLAILEAAACGCALALADIASLRELWGGAALFADPRQPEQWRATLQRLCNDEVLRTRMQRAAAERARRYALDPMVDGYCALYADLLAQRRAPSSSTCRFAAMEARA